MARVFIPRSNTGSDGFARTEEAIDHGAVGAAGILEATGALDVACLAGDPVWVSPRAALPAGIGIVGARISAANTLAVTLMNATAAPIDPAAITYDVVVCTARI